MNFVIVQLNSLAPLFTPGKHLESTRAFVDGRLIYESCALKLSATLLGNLFTHDDVPEQSKMTLAFWEKAYRSVVLAINYIFDSDVSQEGLKFPS